MRWPLPILPTALAGVSLALAGVLYIQLTAPPMRLAVGAPVTNRPQRTTFHQLTFVPPPFKDFAMIAERPAFLPSRRLAPAAPKKLVAQIAKPAIRPDVPPPRPAPPPPPAPPNLTLVGIIGEEGGRLALVHAHASPMAQKLAEGDTIENWKVVHILPDRIVLKAGSTEHEITFPKPSQGVGLMPARMPGVPVGLNPAHGPGSVLGIQRR